MPAVLGAHAEGVALEASFKAREREVVGKTPVLRDEVDELAALVHPRAVDAQSIGLVVGFASVIRGRAVRVG